MSIVQVKLTLMGTCPVASKNLCNLMAVAASALAVDDCDGHLGIRKAFPAGLLVVAALAVALYRVPTGGRRSRAGY